MYCQNCGSEIPDQVLFCTQCGARTAAPQNPGGSSVAAPDQTAVTSPQPPPPNNTQPLYPPQAYVQQPFPVNDTPSPRKKKKKGCLIVLIILLVILAALGFLAASLLGLFGPKDLGVTYTEADYQSALDKIGTDITFDGMQGDDLRSYTRQIKKDGTKLEIDDYTWEHSNFQEKSFELTPAEATALLNEIAPGFYWFENQQIQIGRDGQVEASGTLLLNKAMNDFYPELKSKVPFDVFPRVNLYAKGGISISENDLTLSAETFKTGPIEGISATMLNENADYFAVLYTSVPGLVIHRLEVTDDGNFAVDALIPQTTVISKKLP